MGLGSYLMTQYEAWDLAQSAYGNSLATYAIFLSITSAYLVTAYAVGRDLTATQVGLVTAIFLVVAALLIWSMSGYAYYGNGYSMLGREMIEATRAEQDPIWAVTHVRAWLPQFLALVNFLTVLGCIIFMWNARRPRRTGDN